MQASAEIKTNTIITKCSIELRRLVLVILFFLHGWTARASGWNARAAARVLLVAVMAPPAGAPYEAAYSFDHVASSGWQYLRGPHRSMHPRVSRLEVKKIWAEGILAAISGPPAPSAQSMASVAQHSGSERISLLPSRALGPRAGPAAPAPEHGPLQRARTAHYGG